MSSGQSYSLDRESVFAVKNRFFEKAHLMPASKLRSVFFLCNQSGHEFAVLERFLTETCCWMILTKLGILKSTNRN